MALYRGQFDEDASDGDRPDLLFGRGGAGASLLIG
jgi:hypothetical protein